MIFIAGTCIIFGLWNSLPIDKIIVPIIGAHKTEGQHLSGFPANPVLVIATIVVLLAAIVNHLLGVKRTGAGLKAVDHIHYAPGLKQVYGIAEKGYFDPYNIGMSLSAIFAKVASSIDKANDWIYNYLVPGASGLVTYAIRMAHNGSYKAYLVWSLVGVIIISVYFLK